ncbi:unnamed protein product [Amoebophrya sp. A25]|nr:unnamed protein product [Amoebophrya sp. A25]|eukprot:GSA25T00016039001.1
MSLFGRLPIYTAQGEIADFDNGWTLTIVEDTPQQTLDDCGLFVAVVARELTRWILTSAYESMKSMEKMSSLLKKKHVDDEQKPGIESRYYDVEMLDISFGDAPNWSATELRKRMRALQQRHHSSDTGVDGKDEETLEQHRKRLQRRIQMDIKWATGRTELETRARENVV